MFIDFLFYLGMFPLEKKVSRKASTMLVNTLLNLDQMIILITKSYCLFIAVMGAIVREY